MTTTRRHAVLLAPLVWTLLPLSALAGPQAAASAPASPAASSVSDSAR
ncbi:MAG: hypothetical protein ACXWXO_16295 [Nocardioides sp.]